MSLIVVGSWMSMPMAFKFHMLGLGCDFLQALDSGELVQGGVVTEGSAGSTAISLATVAPAYGCKCHVVIPDDVAIEKVCASNICLTSH